MHADRPNGCQMPTFRHGYSADADWRRAAHACLEQLGSGGGTLGFLYATDHFAADLGLTVATVKTYRRRAFERMGLHFKSELFAAFVGCA